MVLNGSFHTMPLVSDTGQPIMLSDGPRLLDGGSIVDGWEDGEKVNKEDLICEVEKKMACSCKNS